MIGLLICIFSGIFSSLLNFAFFLGDELRVRALPSGASSAMANPIWALTVTGGFLANFVYCVYMLSKNHTWAAFRQVIQSFTGCWAPRRDSCGSGEQFSNGTVAPSL